MKKKQKKNYGGPRIGDMKFGDYKSERGGLRRMTRTGSRLFVKATAGEVRRRIKGCAGVKQILLCEPGIVEIVITSFQRSSYVFRITEKLEGLQYSFYINNLRE